MATPHRSAWIDLAGAYNVRDVAGLPAGDKRVRAGVLLRGDHLDNVTGPDLALLRDRVGLRAIIDLRSPEEVTQPAHWTGPIGVRRLHMPLLNLSGRQAVDDLRHAFENGDEAAAYSQMLAAAASTIAKVLAFLLEPGNTPSLIHCAAGKDRTGITVAVLLAVAGVEEDAIVADYIATGQRLHLIRQALLRREFYREMETGISNEVAAASIIAVLDALRAYEGGAGGFLIAHGSCAADLDRWHDLLPA